MSKTKIEWATHRWNPFVGCSKVSDGCTNCYAVAVSNLYGKRWSHYEGTYRVTDKGKPQWTGRINLAPEHILNKTFPAGAKVFVNSMSDFFHENAKDEWRALVLDIMRRNPDVTYMILTKRPQNIMPMLKRIGVRELPANVWIGATVESSKVLHRLDILRQVPAKVRFISAEPLLDDLAADGLNLAGIHWVIVGGESGRGARPCNPDWIRHIRDACGKQNVSFFFKQWGDWRNNPLARDEDGKLRKDGNAIVKRSEFSGAKGGALLDGRYHLDWPDQPRDAGTESKPRVHLNVIQDEAQEPPCVDSEIEEANTVSPPQVRPENIDARKAFHDAGEIKSVLDAAKTKITKFFPRHEADLDAKFDALFSELSDLYFDALDVPTTTPQPDPSESEDDTPPESMVRPVESETDEAQATTPTRSVTIEDVHRVAEMFREAPKYDWDEEIGKHGLCEITSAFVSVIDKNWKSSNLPQIIRDKFLVCLRDSHIATDETYESRLATLMYNMTLLSQLVANFRYIEIDEMKFRFATISDFQKWFETVKPRMFSRKHTKSAAVRYSLTELCNFHSYDVDYHRFVENLESFLNDVDYACQTRAVSKKRIQVINRMLYATVNDLTSIKLPAKGQDAA